MKFSVSKKTAVGAVAALCALTAAPVLSASAANSHTATTQVSQVRHTAADGTPGPRRAPTPTRPGRPRTAPVKLQPQKFVKAGDKLLMRTLVTTVVNGKTGSKVVNIPVRGLNTGGAATSTQMLAASCDILNLDLGPLDLNLLGLKIHLNEVVLDIVAQSGAGNLLGNLLCSVAGLLDGGLGGVLAR